MMNTGFQPANRRPLLGATHVLARMPPLSTAAHGLSLKPKPLTPPCYFSPTAPPTLLVDALGRSSVTGPPPTRAASAIVVRAPTSR
jgi:hypothetical protein